MAWSSFGSTAPAQPVPDSVSTEAPPSRPPLQVVSPRALDWEELDLQYGAGGFGLLDSDDLEALSASGAVWVPGSGGGRSMSAGRRTRSTLTAAEQTGPLAPRPCRARPWPQIEVGRRLLRSGVEGFSDAELLELVTGSAAPSGHLKGLAQAEPGELVHRLGCDGAARLLASLELGRRLLAAGETRPRLASAEAAYRHLAPQLLALRQEVFHVLALNARNALITDRRIASGGVASCPVDPREVFAVAVGARASGIILAHNHPSGDPEPSEEDLELTRSLRRGAELLGIRLLDHLVIGDGRYVSLAERGLLGGAAR